MIDTYDLMWLPKMAAEYMAEHGWTQHTMEYGDGPVCLTGALRAANRGYGQSGDWLIARAVFRQRGRAEHWNDWFATTALEVETELREHPILDADVAETFGSQWPQIVALVRRASLLTDDETDQLVVAKWAGEAGEAVARYAAYASAVDAAVGAGTAAEVAAGCGGDAAIHAAMALTARHLIGTGDWDQAAYDLLTGPWVQVIGKVHPDDEEANESIRARNE